MRKTLITFIIICIVSCQIDEPFVKTSTMLFDNDQYKVMDGENVEFMLPNDGIYFFTMRDVNLDEPFSREKFNGIKGINSKKFFTKIINEKQVHLTLDDSDGLVINKVTIILN